MNPGLALPELLPPNHPNSSALFLDVRRNKLRGWSTYFANQARHFANRSASHVLCCASSLVNYWPPRIVCPPSPFHPSLPHGRQPNVLLRVLENHSTSLPSAPTRPNRGRRYRSLFSAPGDCKYRQPGSPATLVAASVHVAPSGRRRARDFSSSVRSLDINTPSRISVNEPYLLVPAHVCFSMSLITYPNNTPLVIYILRNCHAVLRFQPAKHSHDLPSWSASPVASPQKSNQTVHVADSPLYLFHLHSQPSSSAFRYVPSVLI